MKITHYVNWDDDSLYDVLIDAGFSESAAKKWSYACYEIEVETDFDEEWNVLSQTFKWLWTE